MGVSVRQSQQEDKMQFLVLATVATLSYARPQAALPAGLTAAACPNYPFCGAQSPADFPVPVVNGSPLAPILNTTPDQTRYYQEAQLVKSPANFPVPVIGGSPWPLDTTLSPHRLTHMKTINSSRSNNSCSRRLTLPGTLAVCESVSHTSGPSVQSPTQFGLSGPKSCLTIHWPLSTCSTSNTVCTASLSKSLSTCRTQ